MSDDVAIDLVFDYLRVLSRTYAPQAGQLQEAMRLLSLGVPPRWAAARMLGKRRSWIVAEEAERSIYESIHPENR